MKRICACGCSGKCGDNCGCGCNCNCGCAVATIASKVANLNVDSFLQKVAERTRPLRPYEGVMRNAAPVKLRRIPTEDVTDPRYGRSIAHLQSFIPDDQE